MPERGIVFPGVDAEAVEHGGRRADVRDDGGAAQIAPRQQKMARFLAREGHGEIGLNRAERFAGVAHDAARHIDGDDREAPRSGGCEYRVHVGHQRAAEPGAEQRIDDELRAVENARVQRLDRRRASARHGAARRRAIAATAPARPTRTGHPERRARSPTTKPSPPLLPGPQSTATGRGEKRRAASRATAVPALCINVVPSVPAAAVARSASSICDTRSSAVDAAASKLNAGSSPSFRARFCGSFSCSRPWFTRLLQSRPVRRPRR